MTIAAAPRIRRGFRTAAIAAFVILLPFAAHALWDYVEARRLSRAVEDIRRRGEPVHFGRLSDGRPITDEQKRAARYYGAAAILAGDALGQRFTDAGALITEMARQPSPARAADPRFGRLAALIEPYEPALELIDRAAVLDARGLDYGSEPRYGFGDRHLANVNAVRVARLALTGSSDDAARALWATLRMRRGFRTDSFLVWPVRTSHSLRLVVTLGIPSDAALRRLQDEYERDDGERAVEEQLLTGRARLIEATWPGAYGEQASLPRVVNRLPRPFLQDQPLDFVLRPWLTNRLTATLRLYEEAIAAARQPWPSKLDAAKALADRYPASREPFGTQPNWRRRIWLPVRMPATEIGRLAPLVANATAIRRASVVVLAIERHRVATGTEPADLMALVPAYVRAVPRDPFSGQPLRYVRTDRGYRVYSVGANRVDDGGAVDVDGSDLAAPARAVESKDVGIAIEGRT